MSLPTTPPLITPDNLRRRAGIYMRQSSPGQVRDNQGSTLVQRDQADFARAFGWSEDQIDFIDDDLGKSGSSTALRGGWQRMIDLIDRGVYGAIFVVDISRLTRVVRDFQELQILCRRRNTVPVINGRPVDLNDPTETFFANIQASAAQFDNSTRTKGLRDSRLAKARRGDTVSQLPVGWIENPDGSFDFDPEVKPGLEMVLAIFRRVRSARGTVRVLNDAGTKIPVCRYGKLEFREPTVDRIRAFVTNESYVGRYIFGRTESAQELGVRANGQSYRRPLPREKWIIRENHHPAYYTDADQQLFREILASNGFTMRHRPRHGSALLTGRIECGFCGATMTVCYPAPNHGAHRYQCTAHAGNRAWKSCQSVQGQEVDDAVEAELLVALGSPEEETLRAALEEADADRRQHEGWVKSELSRRQWEVQAARERADGVDSRNRRVKDRYEDELEKAMIALENFEERIRTAAPPPSPDATAEELRELCVLASRVPEIWRHPLTTMMDRKEIVAAVIRRVVVVRTETSLEIEILWGSGERTPLRRWRQKGVDALIGSLRSEGLTVPDIQKWLAAGDPETGQRWDRTRVAIYQAHRRLGVRPNPCRGKADVDRDRVVQMYDAGRSLADIAEELNATGARTVTGRAWTGNTVYALIGHGFDRGARLEKLHRELLESAKRRGLSNAEAAEDLNRAGVPRIGARPWTADSVRQRRKLLRRQSARADREFGGSGKEGQG